METDEPIKQIYKPEVKNIAIRSKPKTAGLNRLVSDKFFMALVIFFYCFNLALLERGLLFFSSSVAVSGFFVIIFPSPFAASSLK